MNDHDPFYQSGPARYLRWLVEDVHDIEINISERLTTPAALHRELRALYVVPRLELIQFHWLLARGAMELQFPGSVPELQLPTAMDLASPEGAVVLSILSEPGGRRRVH